MNKENKILQLLKSGNFTIIYNDNGSCEIIAKRCNDYETLPCDEDGNLLEESLEFPEQVNGYVPNEVALLVKALGGKVVSV